MGCKVFQGHFARWGVRCHKVLSRHQPVATRPALLDKKGREGKSTSAKRPLPCWSGLNANIICIVTTGNCNLECVAECAAT
eukprot:254662-Pelagomonas_calceolata.AAC.11